MGLHQFPLNRDLPLCLYPPPQERISPDYVFTNLSNLLTVLIDSRWIGNRSSPKLSVFSDFTKRLFTWYSFPPLSRTTRVPAMSGSVMNVYNLRPWGSSFCGPHVSMRITLGPLRTARAQKHAAAPLHRRVKPWTCRCKQENFQASSWMLHIQ